MNFDRCVIDDPVFVKALKEIIDEKSDKTEKIKSSMGDEKQIIPGSERYFLPGCAEDSKEDPVNQKKYLGYNNTIKATQDEALHIMETKSDCLFITGRAGTGKSTLLQRFVSRCSRNVAVVAPSGVAALNVRGETIHSFFRFPLGPIQSSSLKKVVDNKVYKALKVLIIDEISMVRADLLDGIDQFLKLNGPEENKPFGGIQIIVIGDLYQLPPVVSSGAEQKFITQNYCSSFFFDSSCMRQFGFKIVELMNVYRQTESVFLEILGGIRDGSSSDDQLQSLNSRVRSNLDYKAYPDHIVLTSTNKRSKLINETRLTELASPEITYESEIMGRFEKPQYPTDSPLVLKQGAQVMFLRNDPERRWVNGTIGIIKKLYSDCIDVEIKDETNSGIFRVNKEIWENRKYAYDLKTKKIHTEVVGTFRQLPIKLSYALTIHKSQGKTFDRVIIDLSDRIFAHGQFYVAVSRCRSMQNLYLTRNITREEIIVDYRILEFYKDIYRESRKNFGDDDSESSKKLSQRDLGHTGKSDQLERTKPLNPPVPIDKINDSHGIFISYAKRAAMPEPTTIKEIMISRGHQAHKRFVSDIIDLLKLESEQNVKGISFTTHKIDYRKEQPARYLYMNNCIYINLHRVWKRVSDLNQFPVFDSLDVVHKIWIACFWAFFYGLGLAVQDYLGGSNGFSKSEKEGVQYAIAKLKTHYSNYCIEVPPLSEIPYFDKMVQFSAVNENKPFNRTTPEYRKVEKEKLENTIKVYKPKSENRTQSIWRPSDEDVIQSSINQMMQKYFEEMIEKNRSIWINYSKPNGEVDEYRVIVPKKMYMRNRSLYLDAFCKLRNDIRTFKYSRITEVGDLSQLVEPREDKGLVNSNDWNISSLLGLGYLQNATNKNAIENSQFSNNTKICEDKDQTFMNREKGVEVKIEKLRKELAKIRSEKSLVETRLRSIN